MLVAGRSVGHMSAEAKNGRGLQVLNDVRDAGFNSNDVVKAGWRRVGQ